MSESFSCYLVTGGAGFIGSHLVEHLLCQHPASRVINMDKLTYAASPEFLVPFVSNSRHVFIKADICDRNAVETVFKEHQPDAIIHLAAESHVDNSIRGPENFIRSNIVGTFTLLELAREFWSGGTQSLVKKRFHHVSTDEVYGSLENDEDLFHETSLYQPSSPYSASKAASDHLVRAYARTYGLPVTISNCSNNYGPRQHPEKFIPTVIRHALGGQPIPIYGQGDNRRDWLFVGEHCRAIDLIVHEGKNGETYNVGGNQEYSNLDLAGQICGIMDELQLQKNGQSYKKLISFVTDRPGHDFRYAVATQKIERELGWQASADFDRLLRETVAWYLKHRDFLDRVRKGES